MQELLDLILKNITTHPEDVVIATEEQDGLIVFTITVNPEDMGRVIGKNGKVIRSIRSIAHVVGIRKDERYRVNVAEVEGSEAPIQSSPTEGVEVVEEVAAQEVVAEPTAEVEAVEVAETVTKEVVAEPTVEVEAVEVKEVEEESVIEGAIDFDAQPDK